MSVTRITYPVSVTVHAYSNEDSETWSRNKKPSL